MQIRNRTSSIYVQLLRLLILSALGSFLLFAGLEAVSSFLISRHFESPAYVERQNNRYIQKLEKYIRQEEISTADTQELKEWTKKQKVLYLQIFKDNLLVFDSEYSQKEVEKEGFQVSNAELENYYTVEFEDGPAKVSIAGAYVYQLYNYIFIGELLLSFGFFLLFVLMGIRKKMRYILLLRDEIEILEGGSLDYSITVNGKDELADLASGLEGMRKSFQGLIRQEEKMVRENQRIVTEMSHDLRTPVTSIMLYAEILKKNSWKGREKDLEYIEKIHQKARRMKQLTDHLFEYSLITGEEQGPMEEPELYEILFYDLFSETCSYLEQKGFQVKFQVNWLEKKIRISTEYVIRIMDNITSNLVKYADPEYPVLISSEEEGHMAGFSFENQIRRTEEKVESTGIGVQSIRTMTAKMGGRCTIETQENCYRLKILFPVAEENGAD